MATIVLVTDEDVLVSVVLATNRLGSYLAEALESVSKQTHPKVELIAVLNGVRDTEPLERAVRWSMPDAIVTRLPQANVSIARNVGIARAAGRYVAFLDDDDRWHPERLAAQVTALEARPDACASYCGMRVIDEAGEVLVEADQFRVDRLDIARRRTGIISPNIVVRRDALVAVGGVHSRDRYAQDLDLILKLAEYGDFVFVDRPLVDYRTHPDNATASHRGLARSIEAILVFHREMARVRDEPELVRALSDSLRRNRRYVWWRVGRIVRASLADRRPGTAAAEIFWALTFAPLGLVDGLWRRATGKKAAS